MTLRSSTSPTPPITFAGGTVTADAPVISITETWNNVAVTFTGFKINITDTTSAAASLLADFQVAASSKVSIKKDGTITGPAGATFNITANSAQNLALTSGGTTTVSGGGLQLLAGSLLLRSTAASIFATSGAQIGFGSSSGDNAGVNDAAFSRKAAGVTEVNNGTKGAYTGTAFTTGSQTVSQLPAAATAGAGARSFVTDATATTYLSVVAGTGANKVPVVSDGTNWLIG